MIPCKPTGFLIYIPATSPDSCAMAEHMCMLYRQQVITHQQRVIHGSVPFPSPPYSALPLTFSKFAANCQPCVDNKSAVSVFPEQPLNRADTQQQLNGSWSGNVCGNSEPMSAPATHATTNGTAFPYPSATSSRQPLSPTSPTQPSQPPQLVQPAQPIGIGSATRKKHHCVPGTRSNPANSVNGVRNQDQTRKEKQHIPLFCGCGMVFDKPWKFQAHTSRRHGGERLFMCNWLSCGKRFATVGDLKRHRLIHKAEKEYVCKECSERFKHIDHLRQHVKTHVNIQKGNKTSSAKTSYQQSK